MKKKPDKLMELLLSIAENMKACGDSFSQFSITPDSDLKVFSEKIKNYETTGDTYVHKTIIELNHAFITSIDQEDILLLAEKMDDIVDGMENCATYFYMYNMKEADEYMQEFQKNIGLCTTELHQSILLLVYRNLKLIKEHTVNVKSYEEAADIIERKAIRKLFKKLSDPIKIIQHKDLYEMLESVVDDCQNIAKSLDTIVMKNM